MRWWWKRPRRTVTEAEFLDVLRQEIDAGRIERYRTDAGGTAYRMTPTGHQAHLASLGQERPARFLGGLLEILLPPDFRVLHVGHTFERVLPNGHRLTVKVLYNVPMSTGLFVDHQGTQRTLRFLGMDPHGTASVVTKHVTQDHSVALDGLLMKEVLPRDADEERRAACRDLEPFAQEDRVMTRVLHELKSEDEDLL